MPIIKLTQTAVERLKPPKKAYVEYWDSHCPGFGLRVYATGRKTWRALYRVGGKLVPETLGTTATFPSVAERRARARESLQKAAAGINPIAERRQQKADVATVAAVFARYLKEYAARKMRPDYYRETERALRVDMLPALGETPIDKVTRGSLRRDVIGPIVARGREPHATHVLKYTSAFFGWAVAQDIIATNPAAGIPDPDTRRREDRERDRWLSDNEIPLFWYACNRVGHGFGAYFKLLLLLACRRDELAHATWREFDLDGAKWILPGRRSKTGNDHVTFLAPAAASLLAGLPRLRPDDPGEFLFSTTGTSPIRGFSHALDRVRAEMEKMAGAAIPHFSLHDLRRTAATGMAELGVSEHVVDRVLAHTGRKISGTARIYNRSEYLPARQAALKMWADHVMGLVQPRSVADAMG